LGRQSGHRRLHAPLPRSHRPARLPRNPDPPDYRPRDRRRRDEGRRTTREDRRPLLDVVHHGPDRARWIPHRRPRLLEPARSPAPRRRLRRARRPMSAAALVTGARGTTGGRLTARLVAAGHRVKAAGRRPTPIEGAEAIRFDWYRPETYAEALRDVDRMYLLPPIGDPDPAAVMLPFLEQARTAGVRRAVLLSSSAVPAGGPAVGQVHQRLPDLFDQWAVLRPSWFMQNFTGEHMHART